MATPTPTAGDLVLLPNLLPCGPWTGQEQWFALQVRAGMVPTGKPADDIKSPFLYPWQWKTLVGKDAMGLDKFRLAVFGLNAMKQWDLLTPAEVSQLPSAPLLGDPKGFKDKLEAYLQTLNAAETEPLHVTVHWDPAAAEARLRLADYQARVGTYPGSIPVDLNLSVYFCLKDADLKSYSKLLAVPLVEIDDQQSAHDPMVLTDDGWVQYKAVKGVADAYVFQQPFDMANISTLQQTYWQPKGEAVNAIAWTERVPEAGRVLADSLRCLERAKGVDAIPFVDKEDPDRYFHLALAHDLSALRDAAQQPLPALEELIAKAIPLADSTPTDAAKTAARQAIVNGVQALFNTGTTSGSLALAEWERVLRRHPVLANGAEVAAVRAALQEDPHLPDRLVLLLSTQVVASLAMPAVHWTAQQWSEFQAKWIASAANTASKLFQLLVHGDGADEAQAGLLPVLVRAQRANALIDGAVRGNVGAQTPDAVVGLLATQLESLPPRLRTKSVVDTGITTAPPTVSKEFAIGVIQEILGIATSGDTPGLLAADRATPRGLTFEVREATTPPQDGDEFDWLAGYGVLLWEAAKPKEMRLLTLGRVHLPVEASPSTPLFQDDAPALLPIVFAAHAGLRGGTVTYKNEPLFGESYRAQASGVDWQATALLQSQDGAASLMYLPLNGKPAYDSQSLPKLKFGTEYQAAFFAVDHAGGTPVLGLSHPWVWNPTKLQQAIDGETLAPAGAVFGPVTYLREVGIEPLTLAYLPDDNTSLLSTNSPAKGEQWPGIPADVYPLAYDLEPLPASDRSEPKTPLLFLTDGKETSKESPAKRRHTLLVRAPSIGLEVIDQWHTLPHDPANGAHDRIDAAHYDQDAASPENKDKQRAFFQDPAVTGFLLRLERWTGWKDEWQPVTAPASTPTNPPVPLPMEWSVAWDNLPQFKHLFAHELVLTIEVDPAITGFSGSTSTSITIPVPDGCDQAAAITRHTVTLKVAKTDGEVYRLGIAALVEKDDAEKCEHPELDRLQDVVDGEVTRYPLKSGHDIYLEVPTLELPAQKDIYRRLSVRLLSNERSQQVVRATLPDPTPDLGVHRLSKPWAAIGRVEILRQEWQWNGYPYLTPFTFPGKAAQLETDPEGGQDPSAFKPWESIAFDLTANPRDTRVLTAGRFPLTWAQGHDPKDAPALYEDPLPDATKAYYLRYGLRLHSRYAGLMTAPPAVMADAGDERWKRVFRPYQPGQDKIAIPAVLQVVPLTQSIDDHTSNVAGLGLFLDGPAYTCCGVTEQLEAAVTLVDKERWDKGDWALEIGNDPILTADYAEKSLPKAWKGYAKPDDPPAPLLLEGVLGPVGLTHDEPEVRHPLYSKSLYELPPPKGAVPWTLYALQVRRAPYAGAPDELCSEWVSLEWVQVLPDCSWGIYDNGPQPRITLPTNAQRLTIAFPHPFGSAARREILPKDHARKNYHFHYWLLLTTSGVDAAGQRGAEREAALLELIPKPDGMEGQGPSVFTCDSTAALEKALARVARASTLQLHARVLEVMWVPPLDFDTLEGDPEELRKLRQRFAELQYLTGLSIPDVPKDDDTGKDLISEPLCRVTRVSPRFPITQSAVLELTPA